MIPAQYNFQPLKRGDTYEGFKIGEFTYQSTGDGLPIASARLQIKDTAGTVLYEYSSVGGTITISGTPVTNRLDLETIDAATTAAFAVGEYKYDLELTLDDATVMTVLSGTFQVLADITHD